MKISMRAMTGEESWIYLLNQHKAFHSYLKKFGYTYQKLAPNFMNDMFEKSDLTNDELCVYHDKFIKKYNIEKLQRFDDVFTSYIEPKLKNSINKFLVPLLPSWNAILPEKLEILCTFGEGAGYERKNEEYARIFFRMSRFPNNKKMVFELLFHEFVHILIEFPIIQKYNVPHEVKERIVDIICYEFIKKPVQKIFEDSYVNKYINAQVITENLPAAVNKMKNNFAKK